MHLVSYRQTCKSISMRNHPTSYLSLPVLLCVRGHCVPDLALVVREGGGIPHLDKVAIEQSS